MRIFGVFVAAALILLNASGAEAAPPPAWRIFAETPLESNSASVTARIEGAPTAVSYQWYKLNSALPNSLRATSETLGAAGRFEAATQHVFRAPQVTADTFVQLSVTTGSVEEVGSHAPVVVWRGLLRPAGARLKDYTGDASALPPPADFDDYWKRAKDELAKVPMDAKVTRVADRDSSTGLLYKVDLASVRGVRIICFYYMPKSVVELTEGAAQPPRKKIPALLTAPGYGAGYGFRGPGLPYDEYLPLDRTRDGIAFLSINPRGQGPSKDLWKPPVQNYLYNITQPEDYFYKLAFLDVLRATEWLMSRPEVDTARVGAAGGSQGGLFALAAAMLEPRLAACCANVCAFSDYPDGMAMAQRGHHAELREWLGSASAEDRQKALRSLSYCDGANLATRVKVPTQVNMGALDPVCPYPIGPVICNRLPAITPHELNISPDSGHAVPRDMQEANNRWFAQYLNTHAAER